MWQDRMSKFINTIGDQDYSIWPCMPMLAILVLKLTSLDPMSNIPTEVSRDASVSCGLKVTSAEIAS